LEEVRSGEERSGEMRRRLYRASTSLSAAVSNGVNTLIAASSEKLVGGLSKACRAGKMHGGAR
jgi:hypothetical protein